MSIQSRAERGDPPEDIAKIFGVTVEHVKSFIKPAKKKAAKKKTK